ncbi:DUF166 domain-containing protein [Clostridium sp. JNZ X4-2]
MKIQIICSQGTERFCQKGNSIKTDGIFANERFIPNLRYMMNNHIQNKSNNVVNVFQLPNEYPLFLDDPLEYLPEKFDEHDLSIAIGIHEDILMELPKFISDSGSRALLVPLENKSWLTKWVKEKTIEECEKYNLQYAFSKPFCALDKGKSSTINKFIDEFKIGKPKLKVAVDKGNVILNTEVLITTPCGNLYNIPKYLEKKKLGKDTSDSAAKYWHGLSCLGDTQVDPELGDTIIHTGGHIHYSAVDKGEIIIIK